MSTRWYPLYQKGNPQLRIFLPNFWMKLVKSEVPTRKNIVQFHCSMEMTRYDVKNYLEKIYKVPVVKVNTRIALGKTRKNQLGHIVKDDDIKVAYVYLPRNESFEFPNLFEERKKRKKDADEDTQMNEFEKTKKDLLENLKESTKLSPGLPPWFNY